MTTIDEARQFAETAHAGQTRKGAARLPYVTHLAEVAALVAEFGGSPVAIMAAWLHDTVEDCGTSPDEIALQFGPDVAWVVAQLTDDKSLPKAERKALQILHAPGKTHDAALVKICDKLSNVLAVGDAPAVHWDEARQVAYLDWAEQVVSALPGGAALARDRFAAALTRSRRMVADRHTRSA